MATNPILSRSQLENHQMKLSAVSIFALVCLSLSGLAPAQTPADSYRKAGEAYFKAGQFREAATAYQQVIQLAPNDADAYHQLGEAFTRLSMHKEAARAFEKQADILLSGTSVGAATSANAVPPQHPTQRTQPLPSVGVGQLTFKVGQQVEYVTNGKWFKAVITGVRDDSADYFDHKMYSPYQIHSLGYVGEHWVCCADFADRRSQLRPAGLGPTEPVPGGEANDDVLIAMRGGGAKPAHPAFKQYNCGVGSPIAITGNSTYGGGTYAFNVGTSILSFRGGVYDGQSALYEMSYGVARLHIIGQSGRLVIDCD
jgi:hypothetical protein